MPTEPTLTVACHVRAPMLLEPVDAHVETLQAIESEGEIDTLVVRSWPDKVTLSGETPHQEVVEVFERFQRWADRRDVTVRPPFEVRSVSSRVTEEERDVLVTPLICLAIYREDRLAGVFPHTDGEETYTVADAMGRLRTGDVPEPMGAPPVRTGDGTTCPDCDGQLLDGQGLFTCVECDWVGTVGSDGRFRPASRGPVSRSVGRRIAPR